MSKVSTVSRSFETGLLLFVLMGSIGRPAQAALPPTTLQPSATKPMATPPTSGQGPQAFELQVGEQTSFGFAASQPGPILVTVTWQGAPLLVTLVKPGGGTLERQGSGTVSLQYAATAEDVRKGVLWAVNLRAPQAATLPTGTASNQVHEKPVKQQPQVLAKGTVILHHPPGDPKLAQAELKARQDQAKAAQAKPQPAPSAPSLLAQKQAALQKQQATRQIQLLEQVRSKLPAEVHQKMAQKIAAAASQPLPGAKVLGTTLPSAAGSGGPVPPSGTPGTKATKDAPPAGTSDPVIASLSISAGQPGDPVLITGSGFSGTTGEVHFIVANGRDLTALISGWNDGQIFTAVPDVSGLQAFSGQVYVKRGAASSRFVPFQFNPALEYRSVALTTDRLLSKAGSGESFSPQYSSISHEGIFDLFGARGEDEYFLVTRLRNGWVVDSAYVSNPFSGTLGTWTAGNASAYITEFRGGTDSPYVKVHWWREGYSLVTYRPNVIIRGPKGVPHQ
jgi:hypothetical protein